jgi:hypothetical protein
MLLMWDRMQPVWSEAFGLNLWHRRQQGGLHSSDQKIR